jgi:hypothetical protein
MTVDQNFLYKTVNALRVGHVLSSRTVRAFCTSYGSRLRVGATPGVAKLPLRCRNLISISPPHHWLMVSWETLGHAVGGVTGATYAVPWPADGEGLTWATLTRTAVQSTCPTP